MTRLVDLARASAEVGTVSSRLAKTKRLADLLRVVDPPDIAAAVSWLSGELLQRRVGVGYASVSALPQAAPEPSLTVSAVNEAFIEMGAASGEGSQGRRSQLLHDVFAAATEVEQTFLRSLLAGGLRQGALAGVMVDAVALAAGVNKAALRRATMLRGDLPSVAQAAFERGDGALHAFQLEVGRGVHPMLAQTASSVEDALERIEGEVAFEAKLDGARLQIHRRGDEVWLFTRSLDDITSRLPDVVEAVRGWPATTLVADGEIMALGHDARPRPFQETASSVGQRARATTAEGALRVFLFDLLHVDGVDLLDAPASARRAALERLVPAPARVERIVTRDPAAARAFFDRMIGAGFEGVIAKSEAAPYEAGRRGAGWLKVKPVLTLDLVVLAVEWGSGRRRGKLSNIHLGARDPKGGFVMLGKTFKGMTDAMLEWQTARFLELAEGSTDGYVVRLRPEQVVEVAFDGIQTSSRYPGKMALRFARVLRYRDDKTADEADTIDAVRAIHQKAPTPPGDDSEP